MRLNFIIFVLIVIYYKLYIHNNVYLVSKLFETSTNTFVKTKNEALNDVIKIAKSYNLNNESEVIKSLKETEVILTNYNVENTYGSYANNNNSIIIYNDNIKNNNNLYSTILHEYLHSLRYKIGINHNLKKLRYETFINVESNNMTVDKYFLYFLYINKMDRDIILNDYKYYLIKKDYYTNIEELYVRLMILKVNMFKNGIINNYNSEITDEHFKNFFDTQNKLTNELIKEYYITLFYIKDLKVINNI